MAMMSIEQLLTYFDNECSSPQDFCKLVKGLNEKGYHVDMTHYGVQDYMMKLLFNYDDFSHDDSITYIVEHYLTRKNHDKFLHWIMDKTILKTKIKIEDQSLFYDMISSFISDLVLLSNQTNIEFLGMGGFNTAFKIGNYVLKFGTINFYEETNDNQFSNARLCRKVFPEENFMIETSYYLNATKQVNDIFKLYCLIRDNGKKWYDIRLDNIGIVPNDFEHPYKNVSREGLMMLGILDCFVEKLVKGEVRLMDHGYVLEDGEEPVYIYNEKLLSLLDKKYKISKKSNKNKKLSFVKKRVSS